MNKNNSKLIVLKFSHKET